MTQPINLFVIFGIYKKKRKLMKKTEKEKRLRRKLEKKNVHIRNVLKIGKLVNEEKLKIMKKKRKKSDAKKRKEKRKPND